MALLQGSRGWSFLTPPHPYKKIPTQTQNLGLNIFSRKLTQTEVCGYMRGYQFRIEVKELSHQSNSLQSRSKEQPKKLVKGTAYKVGQSNSLQSRTDQQRSEQQPTK